MTKESPSNSFHQHWGGGMRWGPPALPVAIDGIRYASLGQARLARPDISYRQIRKLAHEQARETFGEAAEALKRAKPFDHARLSRPVAPAEPLPAALQAVEDETDGWVVENEREAQR